MREIQFYGLSSVLSYYSAMHPQTGHAMPRVFQINRQTLMDVFALFLNCNGMES